MVTLYLWTVVFAVGSASNHTTFKDWRPNGEFKNATSCERAIVELGLNSKVAKCIAQEARR